ncbi:hypothetical protein AAKU55_002285 [Oxalobacteraceae bacterium GrIS 1.11]
MSTKSLVRITLLSVAVMCAAPVYAAADATMHEVYLAAEAGKFDQAQAMMDQVLRDHPNSGKAHFVEAELLAKQGRLTQAETELANAERLAPGLAFAKPAAVAKLRAHIATLHTAPARSNYGVPSQGAYAQQPAPTGAGIPWGLLLGGAGLIAFVIFAVRFMGRRSQPTYSLGGNANSGPSPGMQPQYGGGAPNGPMMGPSGGGMGSGIMGGLATGAAVGAGIVAGEALMHHFTDSNGNRGSVPYEPPPRNDAPIPDDMGGNDFGVSDNSSWDDSGGGGGSDDWS